MKTVTVFDNLFPLPHPIPLERLKSLGCGRPNDLITTRPINDTQRKSTAASGTGWPSMPLGWAAWKRA
jgi:hypothetical protein